MVWYAMEGILEFRDTTCRSRIDLYSTHTKIVKQLLTLHFIHRIADTCITHLFE